MSTEWDEPRVDLLKHLWLSGQTARAIADSLAGTRGTSGATGMNKGDSLQRTLGEPRSDCCKPVIDFAVVEGRLEVVLWRFGRDFEPPDEHRMHLR